MQIDFSNPMVIAVLVVVALAIIVVIAVLEHKHRTSARLRKRFGAEYDRAVLAHGSPRKAEAILADREKRVKKLKLRELEATERERFVTEWNIVQSSFVDHPKGALTEADELITSLLQARGYPVSGYEDCAEDISVHYPRMIDNYRTAHKVSMLSIRDQASTEELRTAMIQFRNLFDELVKPQTRQEQRPVPARSVALRSERR